MNGALTSVAVQAAQLRPVAAQAGLALAAQVCAEVRSGNETALSNSRYALLASALAELASACERVVLEVRREAALESVREVSS